MFLMASRWVECPKCGESADTKVILSPANAVRVCLEFFVCSIAFVMDFGGVASTGAYFPLTRRCRSCGTSFVEPREPRRAKAKLDVCVKCGYSLTGNVSGQCPECGQELTDEQRRFVSKVG
jgi:predicted RNA-binding Zn-ribbon protein involved in translation (DUF1610 family)